MIGGYVGSVGVSWPVPFHHPAPCLVDVDFADAAC